RRPWTRPRCMRRPGSSGSVRTGIWSAQRGPLPLLGPGPRRSARTGTRAARGGRTLSFSPTLSFGPTPPPGPGRPRTSDHPPIPPTAEYMPGPGVRFRIPPPRRTLLERERLVDALPRDPGRLPRLVLLAAPAGFGKTTLLVQWLTLLRSSADQPAIAWLSVDSNDVEPRHLVSDLVTAVTPATEGAVGARTRAAIDSDAGSDAEALLASLVTEIDEHAGPHVIPLG